MPSAHLLDSLQVIPASAWDALLDGGNPFVRSAARPHWAPSAFWTHWARPADA